MNAEGNLSLKESRKFQTKVVSGYLPLMKLFLEGLVVADLSSLGQIEGRTDLPAISELGVGPCEQEALFA